MPNVSVFPASLAQGNASFLKAKTRLPTLSGKCFPFTGGRQELREAKQKRIAPFSLISKPYPSIR